MDDRTRSFIEKSTLLFIASRDANGAMDVSPRGGQPSVLRLREDGALLMPDYVGNKRLDTIGNLLSNPDVALVLLNRRCNDYLRISARAAVSRGEDDIAAFPADENRPLSVIVLKPTRMELVSSKAFDESGFWVDPAARKPTLDVLDIYARDIRWQTEGGRQPVLYNTANENRLAELGLRDFYGTPSPLVQTKVYSTAGPGFMGFIDAASFIVFAHETASGGIFIDLVGGSPLRRDPDTNARSLLLDLEHEGSTVKNVPHSAKFAILAAEPGRCDNIRLNGTYREMASSRDGQRQLSLQSEEIYFHCSAALTRSRIWTDSRPVAWSGRRRFTCVARREESADVASFTLKPCDKAPVGEVMPGQYVTISLPHDDRPVPRRRCYSVSAVPDAYSLRISVRRIGGDGISALLHDGVSIGDEVLLGPPGGHFILDSAPSRPVALVSAGVGITPLLPMAEQLAREVGDHDVWFIHAARNAKSHLFDEDARRLADVNPRIKVLTAYSQPEPGDICHHEGRLTAEILAAHIPVTATDFYICGPDAFMATVSEGLISLGTSPESIRTEAFAQSTGGIGLTPEMMAAGATSTVTFARSEKTAIWTPACGSLLDLALASGVEVQYSCRSGECQSCTQRVVSGAVSYPSGEEPVLARGQALLCQAIPRGEIVLDC